MDLPLKQDEMDPLLKNAVVSIQLGLEDFKSKDEDRIISAIRNLYSGVLLLCKEVLRRRSPPDSKDVLIRKNKKAVKDSKGNIQFVGHGKETIGRLGIEETFRSLGLAVSLSKLKQVAEIRNNIEHRYSSQKPALMREAIANAMPIIRDIIVRELNEEPIKLLKSDAWDTLLNEENVFREEKRACRATFNKINWNSEALANAVDELRCLNCASSLLKDISSEAFSPDELVLRCSQCGAQADVEIVLEDALARHFDGESYAAMTDGGDLPLGKCPECHQEMYVVDEEKCANCGFYLEFRYCGRCGDTLNVSDFPYAVGVFCGNCQRG